LRKTAKRSNHLLQNGFPKNPIDAYNNSITITVSESLLITVFSFCAAVSKANFVYHFCIGKGGFGKVWRVERKKAKQYYAMKEMSKARIITKRSVKSVINER